MAYTSIFDDFHVDYLYLSPSQWSNLKSSLTDPYFKRMYEENRLALSTYKEQVGVNPTEISSRLDIPSLPQNIPNRSIKYFTERTAVAYFIDRQQKDLEELWPVLDYFVTHCPFTCNQEDGCFGPSQRNLSADLETADASYIVSFVLDTFRDLIPKDLKDRLLDRLIHGSMKGYLEGIKNGDWWRYANFNWGAAVHGGNGCAALAIYHIYPELAQQVLKETLRGLQFILDDVAKGSLCTEGQMYQTTTINHLTDFLAVWHRLTGDGLGWLNNPHVEMSLDFHMHMQGMDGKALNFSNMNMDTTERGGAHFYWWARQYQRPDWAGYEEQISRPWGDTHGICNNSETFWYRNPQQVIVRPSLKQHFHFPGLDWMTFHSGEMWGAFRSGYNANNHNHQSLGHFILGYRDERFLISPGYGPSDPEHHNVVTAGRQADGAKAEIIRIRQWNDGLYWVCDLQEAYPQRTSWFCRHMLLIENTHLLVLDHVIGKRGKRPGVQWTMQTYNDFDLDEKGYTLQGEHSQLKIDFLCKTSSHKGLDWKPGKITQDNNKLIHTLKWMMDADHVHVLHPMMLHFEDKQYEYQCDGQTFSITMNQRRYEVDLYDLIFRTTVNDKS